MSVKIITASNLKTKPVFDQSLGFGKYFTDYMLEMDYVDGKWGEMQIKPYSNFSLAPSAMCLHYGQTIFEGCKAFKNQSGDILLFRLFDNLHRLNKSAERMCMPQINVDDVHAAIAELLHLERAWVPAEEHCSMYVRPAMIATEEVLGVKRSGAYKFFVILSPAGPYFHDISVATRIYIEDNYIRACEGGTGEAKCGGNYGGGLVAQNAAKQRGYDQVLWLDAKERKYIEEVGTMNVMFVVDGAVCTPSLNGSILRGITRHSAIKILRDANYTVNEGRYWVDDLLHAHRKGKLTEMFGVGTAAVISPIGTLGYMGTDYEIGGGQTGEVAKFLYDRLRGIQTGKYPDPYGWVEKI